MLYITSLVLIYLIIGHLLWNTFKVQKLIGRKQNIIILQFYLKANMIYKEVSIKCAGEKNYNYSHNFVPFYSSFVYPKKLPRSPSREAIIVYSLGGFTWQEVMQPSFQVALHNTYFTKLS